MLTNLQLKNFATYLEVTPPHALGRAPNPPNPLGAYDARGGRRDHGSFGLDARHFSRGGALDFEGKRGGERDAGGMGERFANHNGERDDDGGAGDDESPEMLVRQWCSERRIPIRDVDDLLKLLGIAEPGESAGEAQLRRNGEQLDDHNAADGHGRRVRPADAAARAAFDAKHGIVAKRPRLLG